MDVRSEQEHDVKPAVSLNFGHHSPGIRGNHNGSSTLLASCTHQSLDHVHRPQRHHQHSFRSPNPDPVSVAPAVKAAAGARYRECQKNHAANVGGNVYDGCGEFMPSGEEGSLEALKCAACDCHRNFHRKEVDGETQFSGNLGRRGSGGGLMLNPLQLPPPLPSPTVLKYSMHHMSPSSAMVTPVNVSFGGGGGGGSGGTESSSEDLNVFSNNEMGMPPPPPFVLSKKRFRTKFTQDQKEKMTEFAEKLGWRINRQEEEQVEKFCAEVGVKRQVFKVWMHNNKSNMKKQQGDDHGGE